MQFEQRHAITCWKSYILPQIRKISNSRGKITYATFENQLLVSWENNIHEIRYQQLRPTWHSLQRKVPSFSASLKHENMFKQKIRVF